LDRRSAKEEACSEVAHQASGLISTNVCEGTTKQVESSGFGNGPIFAFGGATKDDLGRFAGSRQRCDICIALAHLSSERSWVPTCDTRALYSKEREKESQKDGQQRHSDGHVELNTHHNTRADDGKNKTRHPHPHLDLFVWRSGVLDNVGLILGGPVTEPAEVFTSRLSKLVDALTRTTSNSLASKPNDVILKRKFFIWLARFSR